ncbi:DNA-directed RNA polymerase subunit D [Methanococcus voltae]|uniref:DNA-directed RNA polymerase subunit Rpo3 n=3 Tax=Methanococcus voltae TaxID=2188 RepID=A0A8J7S4P4_METVO|nr:DNA-directed RNA polymerase subunit D [Methanococcus voltae]MBP2201450.1 DNA-directed RNA polymerase subunit D [Methanococcus voltae]MCS3922239.1 DNA-directed RNA polymerase subunit D [Methanococcus voltae PS]
MITDMQKEVKRTGEIITIKVEAPLSFSSALRRIMISELPTYAIENVFFYENTSSMYDEVLAHRLGMVPIKGKPVSSDELITFVVSKEGPCTVYSSDLKSEVGEPAFDNIPLVKLLDGQKLEAECEALVGTGKIHSKWQPCNVVYKQLEDNLVEFKIESHKNMEAEDLIRSALEILKNKAETCLIELESHVFN